MDIKEVKKHLNEIRKLREELNKIKLRPIKRGFIETGTMEAKNKNEDKGTVG